MAILFYYLLLTFLGSRVFDLCAIKKANTMKRLIQAEAIVPFVLALVLINKLPVHIATWAWLPLFLAPDISMLGYAINNRVGAFTYNLFHHQLVAVLVWGLGLWWQQPYLQLAGLVLLGHSSFDRLMGYGLKRPEGFTYTHLGMIGKSKQQG